VRADLDEAKEHLAQLRTLPASVENCLAISYEQRNIATLLRKLTGGQCLGECRNLLSLLERAIDGLPGGPAAGKAAPTTGLLELFGDGGESEPQPQG